MATSKQPVAVPAQASVDEFLAAVPADRRRAALRELIDRTVRVHKGVDRAGER